MRIFRRERLKTNHLSAEAIATKIDEAVIAIRAEAERRDLGRATILISAERLREILRHAFLGGGVERTTLEV
jgi:hypothetical protein